MLLSCRFLLILLCVGSAVALPHSMITGQVQQLGDKLKSVFQNDVKYKEISKFYQNVSTVQIHTQTLNGAKEVIRLSDELSQNIDEVLQMMETNSQLIETVYDKSITQSNKYKSCCQQHFTAAYDSRFNETVDSKQICTSSYSINSQTRDFTTVLKNLQSNIGRHPAVLWQYTGDVNGSYYQYPTAARLCSSPKSSNDFRFKNWYVSTAVPKQKNIVTVVDESYSMKLAINSSHRPFLPKNNTKCVFIPGHPLCPNLLKYAKIAAKTVVDTLNANDWANVIAFSNVPRDPRGCFGDKVAQAHNRNKNTFFKFLNDIKPVRPKGGGQGTFYNSSFQEAFDMLYNAKVQNPDHFKDSVDLILFLTDGAPSDLYPDIRRVIANGNHRMNGSVHIFFYRLGAFGNKEANMLSLPDQGNMKLRYKNYNPAAWDQKHNPPVGPPGYFNALTGDRVKNLREIMGSYYLQFPHSKRYSAKFNLPHMSRKTGMVTTVTQPIYDSNNKFIGVTAIDVHFNTLLKDIISYRHGRFSYAFLLDHNGKVLVHPNYPQMNNVLKTQVNFLDIQYAEPALNGTIIEQMKKQDSGHYRTQVDLAVSRGVSQQDGSVSMFLNTTYYWKSVDNSSYTVVFVLFDPDIHMIQRSLYIGRRSLLRTTWATPSNLEKLTGLRTRIIFAVGHDKTVNYLRYEHEQYADILQINFTDSYYNNTYKALYNLKWIYDHCRGVKLVFKADDDLIINENKFPATWTKIFSKWKTGERNSGLYMGYIDTKSKPHRYKTSPWFIPYYKYPHQVYPDYSFGLCYFLTTNILGDMFKSSFSIPYLFTDDVFIGLTVQAVQEQRPISIVQLELHFPSQVLYYKKYSLVLQEWEEDEKTFFHIPKQNYLIWLLQDSHIRYPIFTER